ncbi:Phosphatidylinositol 3,4,5-trisphosphate-dependent Rac exchanger 2 protein [Vanrija albida]|uniref:Phosphatidylinositol 3,4,5-trisphosphate-dependent Rac exchanger 2 protein n=1 Tax=Vanrija albida TaxID=181172 RepID=A0ABR3Q9P2_9TREE
MSRSPLTYDDGPMVWVDCEMTGLDVANDRIIEIAVIITDGHLNPVDEGISYVINTPKEVLDGMNEWCVNQHGKSGLTQACLDSPHSYDDVTAKVVEYIQRWIPERGAGLLAGSSVHADMRFLLVGMPAVMAHLSYRIVDVSSVKEIARRWYPSLVRKEKESRAAESSHRALDDIRASIRELQFYQTNIFVPIESGPAPSALRDAELKTAV